MKSRAQRYSSTAFSQIELFAGSLTDDQRETAKKKYGSMAHKFPVLVRTAGLAQAVAFVEARGDESQRALMDHLAVTVGKSNRKALYDATRTTDLLEYMLLTRQVLEASVWFKRFAESVLDVKSGDGDD
jgi:CRISPR-associated protein Cmr5